MKTIILLWMCVLFSSNLYAVSISDNELLGTWHVKNETVDPIYSDTRGKVTFHANGTVTVDKGAFAAAGILANSEEGVCSIHKDPIRYKRIGKEEIYLYWEGQQMTDNNYGGYQYYKRNKKRLKKLDAVIEFVKKRTSQQKQKVRLTFIGQGGCATHPGEVRISYLKKKLDTPPPEPVLLCQDLLPQDERACKEDYIHTGEDQMTVVPEGAEYMRVKVWGAGGNSDNGAHGGIGGYTTAVIPVVADDNYTIVVGRWGNNGATENYGFGGSGGGLSGIFTGTEEVLSTDQARAVIVAGGGGASNDGSSGIRNGQSGNDLSNVLVNGDMAAACRIDRGGGGGGYEGGQSSGGACNGSNRTAFGYGGSGFIVATADPLSSSIESGFANCGTVRVPANYLDPDWQFISQATCTGPGTEESGSDRGAAVIIEWLDELP